MRKLEKLMDKYKEASFSDSDIRELMKEDINICTYSNLKIYETVDDLLGPNKICFILYEWEPRYGHWVLLSRSENLIEFFDPYGQFPDSQLELVPEPFKTESGQNIKYLTKLLLKCKYDLSYNEFPFQKLADGIRTCGRWCCLRALLKDISLDNFRELFFGKYSDDLAAFLTI